MACKLTWPYGNISHLARSLFHTAPAFPLVEESSAHRPPFQLPRALNGLLQTLCLFFCDRFGWLSAGLSVINLIGTPATTILSIPHQIVNHLHQRIVWRVGRAAGGIFLFFLNFQKRGSMPDIHSLARSNSHPSKLQSGHA